VQRPQSLDSLTKNNDLKSWQVAEFGNDIINILKKVG